MVWWVSGCVGWTINRTVSINWKPSENDIFLLDMVHLWAYAWYQRDRSLMYSMYVGLPLGAES